MRHLVPVFFDRSLRVAVEPSPSVLGSRPAATASATLPPAGRRGILEGA